MVEKHNFGKDIEIGEAEVDVSSLCNHLSPSSRPHRYPVPLRHHASSHWSHADLQIWQHIQPAMPTADVTLELSGNSGTIRLRLDWTTGGSHGSVKDLKHGHRAASIKSSAESPSSPSRFSLKRHKTKEKE